jgi:hypothetical protein
LTNLEIDEDSAGLNDSANNTSGGEIWELAANWLLDTDLYNEWSNQEDYEVDVESTVIFIQLVINSFAKWTTTSICQYYQ